MTKYCKKLKEIEIENEHEGFPLQKLICRNRVALAFTLLLLLC